MAGLKAPTFEEIDPRQDTAPAFEDIEPLAEDPEAEEQRRAFVLDQSEKTGRSASSIQRRQTLINRLFSDDDYEEAITSRQEEKANAGAVGYWMEFIDAEARGAARIGAAFKRAHAFINRMPRAPGAWAPSETPEEKKASEMRAKKYEQTAGLLWEVAKNPDIAAQTEGVANKAINLIGETLPYITATTAAYTVAGPLGGFAVGGLVEGHSSYQEAIDAGVDEKTARRIGVGVGIVNGAIESIGGKFTEEFFEKVIKKRVTDKIKQAGALFTLGTLVEALEEGTQEISTLTGESVYRDVNWKEAVQRIASSMAGGAFLGGAMRGAQIAGKRLLTERAETPELKQELTTAIQEMTGLPQEEAEQIAQDAIDDKFHPELSEEKEAEPVEDFRSKLSAEDQAALAEVEQAEKDGLLSKEEADELRSAFENLTTEVEKPPSEPVAGQTAKAGAELTGMASALHKMEVPETIIPSSVKEKYDIVGAAFLLDDGSIIKGKQTHIQLAPDVPKGRTVVDDGFIDVQGNYLRRADVIEGRVATPAPAPPAIAAKTTPISEQKTGVKKPEVVSEAPAEQQAEAAKPVEPERELKEGPRRKLLQATNKEILDNPVYQVYAEGLKDMRVEIPPGPYFVEPHLRADIEDVTGKPGQKGFRTALYNQFTFTKGKGWLSWDEVADDVDILDIGTFIERVALNIGKEQGQVDMEALVKAMNATENEGEAAYLELLAMKLEALIDRLTPEQINETIEAWAAKHPELPTEIVEEQKIQVQESDYVERKPRVSKPMGKKAGKATPGARAEAEALTKARIKAKQNKTSYFIYERESGRYTISTRPPREGRYLQVNPPTIGQAEQPAIEGTAGEISAIEKPLWEAPRASAEGPKRFISKDAYEAARKRLTDPGMMRMGVDPRGFADIVTIGAYHIESGLRDFAAWSKRMIEEFGEAIKPQLQSIWDSANNLMQEAKANVVRQRARTMIEQAKADRQAGFTRQRRRRKSKPQTVSRLPREVFPEIKGQGEVKPRGLAENIANELLEATGTEEEGVPTYQVASQKERLEQLAIFVTENPEQAKRIAMGQEEAPRGFYPEDVLTAVRIKARQEGDYNTLRDIETMSTTVVGATELGRRIQALSSEALPEDPSRAMQDLIKVREQEHARRTSTPREKAATELKKTKREMAKSIKKEIQTASTVMSDWVSFIESLQC